MAVRGCGRREAEALQIDSAVDHRRLPGRRGNLPLELSAQVVRDRDHGLRADDDEARGGGGARDRADVCDVLAVRGDDERRADSERGQAARDEKVGVDDVRSEASRCSDHSRRKDGVSPLPAGAPVEHRTLDMVAALGEGELELADEDAEIRVVRARIHLRDEQDAHVYEALRF